MSNQPTVLLIDDDSDDQEIFSLALEKASKSVNCVFANDGIEALEKLADQSCRPDFIFIDMNMPRMNGQQCLAAIRKIEWLDEVPVYMYSTSADPVTVAENKSLGATDFIVKSADIYALSKVLTAVFQKQLLTLMLFVLCFAGVQNKSFAQTTTPVTELKKLSVEELMNIEVTSVSKTPEKITETASAIQVVTGNDIKRSTAMRLPEAMRLAPNIQIAQAGAFDWGITSRGFNGAPASATTLANKLLVMIDGRSVYTPLFGGVFWDVQNVMLEDVDRIEIVSGPGGTLWGSNAVNGVVNVISKSARETQGLYASVAAGNFLQDMASLRYGSNIDSTLFFRVYGQHFDYNSTELLNGSDARDELGLTQGGFRFDYYQSDKNKLTLQGDIYSGAEGDSARTMVNGQNVIGRWTHTASPRSSFSIQSYVDRTYRNIQSQAIIDDMMTYDIEAQHNILIGSRNRVVWGLGYRYVKDDISTSAPLFAPEDRTLHLTNAFIQDRFEIIKDRFALIAGTKVSNTTYTDFEIQPSFRLTWTPEGSSNFWGAVSRSVRTPSRYDTELIAPVLGSFGEFQSEKVIAYEAGWRYRPFESVSIALAGYFNQYDDLRSIDSNLTPLPVYYFANSLSAETYGVELSVNLVAATWLRFRGGYTFLEKSFTREKFNTYPRTDEFESIDPQHMFIIHLISDIGQRFQVNGSLRYVDVLSETVLTPKVPSYFNVNLSVMWKYKWLSLKVAGQNLLEEYHHEFGFNRIPRSIYGQISIDI